MSNFRSINGTITVPLNAPVILVHGPNRAGKTSILSAIELAVTGEIWAMQRSDANYRSHLIHRGADHSKIILDGADPSTSLATPHQNIIRPDSIDGGTLLSGGVARFFSERCHLAQATLSRLLEMYQNANPREESALTRFVKDPWVRRTRRADRRFASCGDVRNTRRLSPRFADAETKIRAVDGRIIDNWNKLAEVSKKANGVLLSAPRS